MVPLAEARNRLSERAGRVVTAHERIIVSRNGRPAFVLVALDDIESLEETLLLRTDPEAMAGIRESEAEHAAGLGVVMSEEGSFVRLREVHASRPCGEDVRS
ncbi:type II toxin-antitoxin system Phd/YefM family antitoxin [Nakamurella sp. GG22]